jgi:hypothetical protein
MSRRRSSSAVRVELPPYAKLAALRHRRDVLDDVIALERNFEWERTARRLQALVTAALAGAGDVSSPAPALSKRR